MKAIVSRMWLIEAITLVIVLFTLTGCGQNIFKGMVPKATITDTRQLVDSGQYSDAIVQANKVITSTSATDAQKQTAYQDKGIAILAQNKLTFGKTVTLANQLSEALKSTDAASSNLSVLKEETNSISLADAIESADALNEADRLGSISSSSLRTQSTSLLFAVPLSENVQLTRAFANRVVVQRLLLYATNVDDINSPQLNTDHFGTVGEALTYLCGSNRGLYYYMSNSRDAYIKANCLNSSDLKLLDKAYTGTLNTKALYVAFSTGTKFRVVNFDGSNADYYTMENAFSGKQTAAEDKELKEALGKIRDYVKSL